MKTAAILLVLAMLLAAITAGIHDPQPLEHRLIRVQAEEAFPDVEDVGELNLELQAALLDLSEDPLVSLKARAAVLRYPDMAARVFPLFAPEPEFQDILRRYGESVLPAIDYFLQNPVGTIESMNTLARHYDQVRDYMQGLQGDSDDEASQSTASDEAGVDSGPLTPEQRGWYAVNFIDTEGHGFLGQFEVGEDGTVHWIQTERITEGVTDFFTSGIRRLETRQRTGEEIRLSDIGWASVDVLVFASAVKVLRAGRAVATTTRGAGISTRSAALAARVTGAGRLVLRSARYARWPAVIGVGYLVVRHPAVISDVLAEMADLVGVPGWLMQWAGWTLILLPLLVLARWLLIPLAALLRALVPVLLWLGGRARRQGGRLRLRA
ncbi:hypothetical protein [Marinobacter zhanjiangensis]|uniref:Uncharacterized protein n=1 Tax=Marinobacter zhanjiangensis TaxID=578215 RepID=A0ABQ3AMP1_9GAMM|nr:hypothetical protein [Marinobacter zhanjiangensis]GGY62158.1 hypothetical protein GCM10007071_06290 [Marinobacter zhanjiangensis]